MDEHLLPLVIFGNNYRELQADKSPAGKSHCTDWKEKAPCPNTIVQNIKWERSEKHLFWMLGGTNGVPLNEHLIPTLHPFKSLR